MAPGEVGGKSVGAEETVCKDSEQEELAGARCWGGGGGHGALRCGGWWVGGDPEPLPAGLGGWKSSLELGDSGADLDLESRSRERFWACWI